MTGLVKVRLHGHLAQAYGREHEFVIRSPGEAFRAFEANYRGFRKTFLQAPHYYLRVDGDWRDGSEGWLMPASREVDIIPDIEGAGLETLIATGLVTYAGFTAGAASTAIVSSLIASVLITAVMVGLSLLLAPKPKKNTTDDKKEDSFMFSGADATVGQGAAVPLVYGRVWVPPTVISAGLETGDESIAQSQTGPWAGTAWGAIGGGPTGSP